LPSFSEIAGLLAIHCKGKLDVVVVSHRDRDHIAGFADREAFRILCDLSPSVIVRPWVDDPRLSCAGHRVAPRLRRQVDSESGMSLVQRASRNLRLLASKGRVVYLERGSAPVIEQALPGV
jgi:metal-dependent hydrolase (beta-lactamase superfamily II)